MRKLAIVCVAVACTQAPIDTEPDSGPGTDVDTDTDAAPLTLTDVDGNVYVAVQIGPQVWMAENLKVTSFADGTAIPAYSRDESWFSRNDPQPRYQWAETSDLNDLYDEALPEDFYGAMYNEAVLASGNLAPSGWRIPTRADFEVLLQTLEDEGHDTSALASTWGWSPETANGTDVYGFNALPSGYVSAFGTATGVPIIASWATSDTHTDAATRTVVTRLGSDPLSFDENSIQLGAPVRLIRE